MAMLGMERVEIEAKSSHKQLIIPFAASFHFLAYLHACNARSEFAGKRLKEWESR